MLESDHLAFVGNKGSFDWRKLQNGRVVFDVAAIDQGMHLFAVRRLGFEDDDDFLAMGMHLRAWLAHSSSD